MVDTVKKKFYKGIAWTFVENILVRGFSFAFTIVLARILMPTDYGLVGMLAIFIAISQVLISSGMVDALIQKQDCSDIDFSTAFYFNFLVSVFAYLVLFISAPYIAAFYQEEELCKLLRVLAVNFVIGSLALTQRAKLAREMNFRATSIVALCSSLISGLVGVIMAFMGYGVWSLVFSTIASTVATILLFPVFSKWLPKFEFSRRSFLQLWAYGSKLIVTGLSSVFVLNLSSILIGRYYKSEQVGFYTRAQSFGDLPSTILFAMFSSVTFPVLCQCQKDMQKLMKLYKRILFHVVLISCPLIFSLVLLSRPMVIVFLTEKWLPCVPLLQFLLLARLFLPIGSMHTNLLRSTGKTGVYMKLYFVTGPLSLLGIVIAIPFGVKAMAFATFVSAALSYLINSYVIGYMYGYGIIKQMRDWKWIFLSLIIMSAGILGVLKLIDNAFLQLIVGTVVGFVLYALCCYVFKLLDEDIVKLAIQKIRRP